MKKIVLHIFLLFSIMQMGCHTDSITYQQMIKVDSLVRQNLPDSAYRELVQVKSKIKTEREKAYYGLLLTRISDMRFTPLSSDTLISQSVEYYKKSGEQEKLAQAYLCKGINLYGRRNVRQAVVCLKECERLV